MVINGHNLHLETHGPADGQPVILLHHGLGSTRAWRGQIPALMEAGYRVVVYDRWGYGQSDPRPALSTPSFTADIMDLLVLMDEVKIKCPIIIGHSDGGTIGLYLAIQYPKLVSKLVVVAAHIYLEARMEPGINGIKHNFEQDTRFRKGLQRAHGDKFNSVFNNWFDGWHKPEILEWDMRPILPEIICPTLVIQGEDDEHATPQHARDIAENIPNAELWLVPGARHMLPQEMADGFNQKVLEFLCSTKF